MNWFRSLPMGALAVIVGVITAIAWLTLEGTVPVVISIVAGGLIALKATLQKDEA